jgi:hypothetical protein
METPSIFESMAEVGITLAGFSAVFRAFRGTHDPDGFHEIRVRVVIEGGLLLALMSYLPAALAAAGLSPVASWKAAGLPGALWLVNRIRIGVNIFRTARPLPPLFPLAFCLAILFECSYLGTISGFAPWSALAGHLISVLTFLVYVGAVFLAQFRAERAA